MIGVLAIVASYFLGAIPFGVIAGKLTKGIDIRDFGSGNIGFTNAFRTLGTGPAIVVLVLDAAKGFASVAMCKALGLNEYWIVACGLLSVLGHTFSVFLGFRGGRGVATSLGVIIGLNPAIAAVAFGIWAVLVGLTRYVSIASIAATISVPLQMFFWESMHVPTAYQVLAVVAALAIILKHTSNMRRLLAGTEPKFGQKVDIGEEGREENDE